MARYVCNVSFGVSAVCVFAERPDSGARKCETLLRRFVAGGGNGSWKEFVYHTEGVVQLLLFSLWSPRGTLGGVAPAPA